MTVFVIVVVVLMTVVLVTVVTRLVTVGATGVAACGSHPSRTGREFEGRRACSPSHFSASMKKLSDSRLSSSTISGNRLAVWWNFTCVISRNAALPSSSSVNSRVNGFFVMLYQSMCVMKLPLIVSQLI